MFWHNPPSSAIYPAFGFGMTSCLRGAGQVPWEFLEAFLSKKIVCASFALFLFSLLATAYRRAAAQSGGESGYHLIKKVKLGGSGGWDYLEVDPATHR